MMQRRTFFLSALGIGAAATTMTAAEKQLQAKKTGHELVVEAKAVHSNLFGSLFFPQDSFAWPWEPRHIKIVCK